MSAPFSLAERSNSLKCLIGIFEPQDHRLIMNAIEALCVDLILVSISQTSPKLQKCLYSINTGSIHVHISGDLLYIAL